MTFFKNSVESDITTDLTDLATNISKLINEKTNTKIIAKYISYILTGNLISKYNQDLEAMLREYPDIENGFTSFLLNIYKEIRDNGSNCQKKVELLIEPIPSFNLSFKNQKNLHPNVDFLHSILLPFHTTKTDLILDLYTDETFGSNCTVYELLKIVPYVNDWYGIIYNSKGLFNNVFFISSLKYCKGLFVFSQVLKIKLDHILLQRKIDVRVFMTLFSS